MPAPSLQSLSRRLLPLALISLAEYGAPLVRMLAMSHGLSLVEVGMASVLTATYAAIEQITDFAVSRFLFSIAREKFAQALAAAHALSIARGFVVMTLAILAAPFIAAALGLSAYTRDFLLIAPVILIKALENLAPRAQEREYRYGAQFKAALAGNIAGAATLVAGVVILKSHKALIASLYAQALAQTAASHVLAKIPYRASFGSALFLQAIAFGAPLMLNGFGLMASAQGDRFIVASFLGLSSVGVYAVAILATSIPMSALFRITGTVLIATLYNSHAASQRLYEAGLKTAAQILPIISAFYAIGVLALLNIAMPLVFGRNFAVYTLSLILIAAGYFLRALRGEPFSSLLLHSGQTMRLAAANLASASALLYQLIFVIHFKTFEALLAGRVAGEATALFVTLILTNNIFKPALLSYLRSAATGMAAVALAIFLTLNHTIGQDPLPSLAAVIVFAVAFALFALREIAPNIHHAFAKPT